MEGGAWTLLRVEGGGWTVDGRRWGTVDGGRWRVEGKARAELIELSGFRFAVKTPRARAGAWRTTGNPWRARIVLTENLRKLPAGIAQQCAELRG
jgi:hypothetical protein